MVIRRIDWARVAVYLGAPLFGAWCVWVVAQLLWSIAVWLSQGAGQ